MPAAGALAPVIGLILGGTLRTGVEDIIGPLKDEIGLETLSPSYTYSTNSYST